MSRRTRAAVVVGIAVLAFLVGGAAEAGRLVTGKQVRDASLSAVDVRDNTLTGADVAAGSIHPGQVDAATVGPVGPPGEQGPAGPPGLHGLAGVRGVEVGTSSTALVLPGETAMLRAFCPFDTTAAHGGVSVDAYVSDARMTVSAPLDDGSAWITYVRNGGSGPSSVRGYAVCIDKS